MGWGGGVARGTVFCMKKKNRYPFFRMDRTHSSVGGVSNSPQCLEMGGPRPRRQHGSLPVQSRCLWPHVAEGGNVL